nr:MAG TPA: hypothetical protein [Bacteriophage sp.]
MLNRHLVEYSIFRLYTRVHYHLNPNFILYFSYIYLLMLNTYIINLFTKVRI